jgi:hypothetical protein
MRVVSLRPHCTDNHDHESTKLTSYLNFQLGSIYPVEKFFMVGYPQKNQMFTFDYLILLSRFIYRNRMLTLIRKEAELKITYH